MARHYAEVVIRHSFEFGQDDMDDAGIDDPQEYAKRCYDEHAHQGFDFDSVSVEELPDEEEED